jgi:hypothetical protein
MMKVISILGLVVMIGALIGLYEIGVLYVRYGHVEIYFGIDSVGNRDC